MLFAFCVVNLDFFPADLDPSVARCSIERDSGSEMATPVDTLNGFSNGDKTTHSCEVCPVQRLDNQSFSNVHSFITSRMRIRRV